MMFSEISGQISNEIFCAIAKIRSVKPMILCLTNYVTMDLIANSLLALGAAPIISHDTSELEELVACSGAVNINIGTFDNEFVKRAKICMSFAKRYNKPVVFDPVGAGSTTMRTEVALQLASCSNIIRGNATEVMAFFLKQSTSCGVEAMHHTEEAVVYAKAIALEHKCTVVVSGEKDYVTDGYRWRSLAVGDVMMTRVTGMGCVLTAIISAFHAVISDPFEAASLATAYVGLCGSAAAEKSHAPGSFRTAFVDELYTPSFLITSAVV